MNLITHKIQNHPALETNLKGRSKMKVNKRVLVFLFACLILSACATVPNYRSNPQLNEKIENTKIIMVIPLKTDVYQITAGGVQEKMDEWSSQARNNVMTAIQAELGKKTMIFVKSFEETLLSEDQKSNLEETKALFDAVNDSIIVHTYGPPEQRFQDKIRNFNYSMGREVQELARDTDALLFVNCSDQIATTGRKALQAGSVILGALVGVYITPQYGVTTVNIALVDSDTGSILWYNYHGSPGDHDLRNPIDTTTLVKQLFKDFPM
jgi:hypothetical protein